MFGSAPQGHFLRGALQGGEQADQQISADFDTLGILGSLIAFLWSAAEYLQTNCLGLK
ncbi:MAG: hypothetical protein U9O82_01380 [Thermodesulfobacteriota bacterium]|nr:hypothetical protein [Thermodesulfobacteriota bacterium]